jgi:hypothetical protein
MIYGKERCVNVMTPSQSISFIFGRWFDISVDLMPSRFR